MVMKVRLPQSPSLRWIGELGFVMNQIQHTHTEKIQARSGALTNINPL